MPTRLVRDGLLESEAVLSLPVEARWLFVTIVLSADDLGLFEAKPFKLARRADIRRESVEKFMHMLADADLVRLYSVDSLPFGFIPKFRQRVQIKRGKHPMPPIALLNGDADALSKFNKLSFEITDGQPFSTDGEPLDTVGQPPEAEAETEKTLASPDGDVSPDPSGDPIPRCPHRQIVAAYHRLLPSSPRVVDWTEGRKKHLATRWREKRSRQTLEWWERFFAWIAESDFLTGRAQPRQGRDEPFVIDIDWLLAPKNFVKVIEGRYHPRVPA